MNYLIARNVIVIGYYKKVIVHPLLFDVKVLDKTGNTFLFCQSLLVLVFRRHYKVGAKVPLPKSFTDWEPGCTISCGNGNCNKVRVVAGASAKTTEHSFSSELLT